MKTISLDYHWNRPDNFTGIVEDFDGNKFWFLNGEVHRLDGPAIEYADGTKSWYLKGAWHRLDGPASEYADGSKFWFLNGEIMSEEAHFKRTASSKQTDHVVYYKEMLCVLTTPDNILKIKESPCMLYLGKL
jgi:hypothetical protein